MLVARPYGDISRFEAVASHLVQELVTGGSARAGGTKKRRAAT